MLATRRIKRERRLGGAVPGYRTGALERERIPLEAQCISVNLNAKNARKSSK